MNLLRKFGIGLFLCLLLTLWGMANHSVSCQAEELKTVSASMVKPKKVKITIAMLSKEIDQIRIFRREDVGRWEKIATLKGSAKSYKDTVKLNHTYGYKVAAYRKRGKKYQKFGSETCSVDASILPISWYGYADEQDCYPVTTPESISIKAEVYPYPDGGELRPSGYKIYRSTDNKKFECIKTVHTIMNPYELEYTDTDVESGQTYYYKLRGFFRYHKQLYYSSFSHTETCMAVNSSGIYFVKVLTARGKDLPALDVCLTSEKGNADLTILNTGSLAEGGLGDFYSDEASSFYPVLITQYSTDGTDWFPIEEDSMVLKPGQVLYLRFERADGMGFDLTGERAVIYDIPISCYRDRNILHIDLIQQKVWVSAFYD